MIATPFKLRRSFPVFLKDKGIAVRKYFKLISKRPNRKAVQAIV
jgi:hypothetical protein